MGDKGIVWGRTINVFGRIPAFRDAELEPEAVSGVTGEAGRCSFLHMTYNQGKEQRVGDASKSKASAQGP